MELGDFPELPWDFVPAFIIADKTRKKPPGVKPGEAGIRVGPDVPDAANASSRAHRADDERALYDLTCHQSLKRNQIAGKFQRGLSERYMIMKDWIFVMADQIKMDSSFNGKKDSSQRSSPCSPKVESPDLNKRYVDITAMVRSLQRTEGMTDCFRRGIADCNQLECSWRQYCFGCSDDRHAE